MEKTKIEELYNEKKTRGFINHLIKSYLPLNKVTKIWDFDKGQSHKCNVCGQKLFSIADYFNGLGEKQKEIFRDMGEFVKKTVSGEELKRSDHPIVKHIIGDKVLGWTGDNTDTILCKQCVEDLLSLTQNGILRNDKNIIWLTNKMRRSEFFNQFENSSLPESDKEEAKNIHKKVEKKKVTFADLGVLQELKEKMETKLND